MLRADAEFLDGALAVAALEVVVLKGHDPRAVEGSALALVPRAVAAHDVGVPHVLAGEPASDGVGVRQLPDPAQCDRVRAVLEDVLVLLDVLEEAIDEPRPAEGAQTLLLLTTRRPAGYLGGTSFMARMVMRPPRRT